MNKSSIIEVRNLVKQYKPKSKGSFSRKNGNGADIVNAVDDISFTVKEGELFALLGPNGAGKTTTLSILNTTLAKTSGDIKVAGFDIENEASKVRKKIGVIFQNPSLDVNLTAEENIRFHANLYDLYPYAPTFKMMPAEYREKVHILSKVLGLKVDELFDPIKSYSGGMKRKLEIIRGLMHNPKVLFLDEPTTGLDPISRKNLWKYLQEVRERENITVFVTTHYLDEVENADRLCIINSGKIIAEGAPSQIKKQLIDEHLVIDANDREKLINELTSKNVKFEGSGPFTIDIDKNHEVQNLMKKIDTTLTTVKVYSPTLEEAYISLIENAENDDKK